MEGGQSDARDALAHEADLSRSALGKVDSAAVNVQATIVDPDHDRFSVVEVRHAHLRSHREGTRGCGQSIFPEDFAAAGALAIETPVRTTKRASDDRTLSALRSVAEPSRQAGSIRLG
jgi:hypothetical protein